MIESVCLVGAGQAGRALGRLLHRAGFRVDTVVCRTWEHAQRGVDFIGAGRAAMRPVSADLILLAVPDDQIAPVAGEIQGPEGKIVAHLSGSRSLDVLEAARRRGARVGSLHPLRSFADPESAVELFPGTYCAIEGEPAAELEEVARRLGGRPIRLGPEGKALYHVGAVFASNYLVSLLAAARSLFEAAGIPREEALDPLVSLAEGTLRNIGKIGIPAALSGPIERGDVETVRRHRRALGGDLLAIYDPLARWTCEVARAKGTLSGRRAVEILEEVSGVGRRDKDVPPEPTYPP